MCCPVPGAIRSKDYRKNATQSLLSRNSQSLGKVWLTFFQRAEHQAPSLPGAVGWGWCKSCLGQASQPASWGLGVGPDNLDSTLTVASATHGWCPHPWHLDLPHLQPKLPRLPQQTPTGIGEWVRALGLSSTLGSHTQEPRDQDAGWVLQLKEESPCFSNKRKTTRSQTSREKILFKELGSCEANRPGCLPWTQSAGKVTLSAKQGQWRKRSWVLTLCLWRVLLFLSWSGSFTQGLENGPPRHLPIPPTGGLGWPWLHSQGESGRAGTGPREMYCKSEPVPGWGGLPTLQSPPSKGFPQSSSQICTKGGATLCLQWGRS